jgi:hypothetical protein
MSNEDKIIQLRKQSRDLILPRRSIAFQFQNMRWGNRNIIQQLAIRRKERKKIAIQISKLQVGI